MCNKNYKSHTMYHIWINQQKQIITTNIYKIAYNAVNNKERPNYLSRSNNTSTGLDDPVKPKFTCLEIGKPC